MNLLREPLVRFLVLGAGLFGLFALVGDGRPGPDERIVVTEETVAQLEQAWKRQWQRPPTPEELEGLIEDQIREEVFYREAMAMGLDKDDAIIRRRLAQKIELLSEDLAGKSEPSEADLEDFLRKHPDRFRLPVRFTFTHIYLDPDQRGDAARSDADLLLGRLEDQPGDIDVSGLGDRFMLQLRFIDRSEDEIGQLFGSRFSEDVMELAPGRWLGPVESGYGIHLVFVHERSASRSPELDEVRDEVRMALFSTRRREAIDSLHDRLRDRYDIVVQGR